MPKAIWNGKTIAETDIFEVVEGNIYFPPDSLKQEYFAESDHTSVCGWKGTANYYTVSVDGKTNPNAAWVYREPYPKAANIKNYVAFWKGFEVQR
jgi:uncharacterized protein (DUF427 family)